MPNPPKTELFVRSIPGGFYSLVNERLYPGPVIWVDATNGVDTNNGGPDDPLKTIAAAVLLCAGNANSTILLVGDFTEAVIVTSTCEGLRIIGVGTGKDQTTWAVATDGVCLTLRAANCLVQNIKFRPGVYAASRDTAAIELDGANYARIENNRFQGRAGSQAAITCTGSDSDNVEIIGNEFIYMNTATYGAGIRGTDVAGLALSGWKIIGNIFNSCVTAIDFNSRCGVVKDNVVMEYGLAAAGTLGAVLALGIDLSGTGSGCNAVVGNQLGGTYNATLYKVGATGDQWAGNYNVITGGLTAANPA